MHFVFVACLKQYCLLGSLG